MDRIRRKMSSNSIVRMVLVAISFLLQIGWLLVRISWLNEYSQVISALTGWLALVVVLHLNGKDTNPAMKMPWIMLIMAFPVMGLSMYILFVLLGDPGVGKRMRQVRQQMRSQLPENGARTLERLEQVDLTLANHSRYLWRQENFPVYENTQVTYYPEAVQAFEALKADLEQAQKFIFMEYFIVREGSAFQELEEILARKVRQGVEVRLMYDDLGSAGAVNFRFARRLSELGIRCRPFNPALPVLNLFLNHRDHRKITVIDGKVGFTGGYNLSDEYFDRRHPYGKWKDTGLRLEGEAVRSLSAMFLELWRVQRTEQEDFSPYLAVHHSVPAPGFVQPFGDDPLGQERLAENVYLNLAYQADKSLYFITPYLIITDEMTHALGMAAMRGVDVRIITPGIPDKRTVYAVTRSYYAGLVRQGVRIFEYSPGFCHAKQCICDSKVVSLGTSNLDYRSLYHHFENNVLFSGCDAVQAVARDFEALFPQCREVTEDYRSGRNALLLTWQCILRLFAPLM